MILLLSLNLATVKMFGEMNLVCYGQNRRHVALIVARAGHDYDASL